MYYILDENNQPVKTDSKTWAEMFADPSNRRIAVDEVGPFTISTVFLGLDLNFTGDGPPLLFETMIFEGIFEDVDMQRCSTYEGAQAMHKEWVKKYREMEGK